MSRAHTRRRRRAILLAAGTTGAFALVVRLTTIVPSGERTAITTILVLASVCMTLALLANPVADAAGPPLRLVDGPTIVRVAVRRDGGRIIDTIDAEVADAMGWLPAHRLEWAAGTAEIDPTQTNLFVICTPESERPIGVITVRHTDQGRLFKLGMWLGPNGRGEGHMRRALTALTDHLVSGNLSLIVETAADNVAARKSIEGAGFDQIGAKLHRLPNGTDIDAVIYARYADAGPA